MMNKFQPPQFADRLLEYFCAAHLLEEVQGDLHELYGQWVEQHGVKKARWLYIWHTLKFFRPFVLKRKELHNPTPQTMMLHNYLKVSIRNVLKYKTFSFINVFGLAVALSVCMLIILMLADQKGYDQFHVKKDRIYRILAEPKDAKAPYATTPVPLANTLKNDYPAIEASTHLIQGVGGEAIYQQRMAEMRGFFADTSFFDVFSYPLAKGNSQTALQAPNTMVITQALATSLFQEEDPLGKTVEWIDRRLPLLGGGPGDISVPWGLYTVTGVIDNKNHKSHLTFDVLISSASLPVLYAEGKMTDLSNDWPNHFQCYTYALLYPESNIQDLTASLHDIAQRQYAGLEDREDFQFSAQPLMDITPGPILGNAPNHGLPLVAYYVLASLALIIMLSACLNYTNLSIARALTRAKEIGVRKVTGALRKDLVYQFLSESMMTALLALGLAIVLLFFLKNAFMDLWINRHLRFELQENMIVYSIFVGFALIIGLFAGFYPALFLSKYRPVKVLKNIGNIQPGKLGLRRVISTSQFIISLCFIVTSLLIYRQFKHFLAFDYGFSTEHIINVPLQGNDYQLVTNELQSVAGVSTVSASEYIPATGTNNGTSLRKAGSEEEYTYFISLPADENFVENLEVDIVAGKDLPPAGTASERFIVVNEAAVKAFGYASPAEMVGLVLDSKWDSTDLEVIGVVEDFRIDLPMNRDETRPMMLRNQPDLFRYVNIKIASGDLSGTVARLAEKWKNIDPVHPFQYEFYDQQLAATHQGILDIVTIISFIAFLAITIACLGLLGMAIYTTERRTKEVGIRKVLGAKTFSIALLLSQSFLKMLLISIGIAAPLSYFLNNFWLQYLPNRVDFGIGTIVAGTLLLLVLGGITIGSQTIRAAQRNPVDSLRDE